MEGTSKAQEEQAADPKQQIGLGNTKEGTTMDCDPGNSNKLDLEIFGNKEQEPWVLESESEEDYETLLTAADLQNNNIRRKVSRHGLFIVIIWEPRLILE